MENKITDFKLAESILRAICRRKNFNFVDIGLDLDGEKSIEEGYLNIGKTKNIAHTIYKIISEYIDKSFYIFDTPLFDDDEAKERFMVNLATSLRGVFYGKNGTHDCLEELTLQNLYQKPLIWILMKDIVCPVFQLPLLDVKIVTGSNPHIDIARYYKKGEIEISEKVNYPFIFVNEIGNKPVQNAFIFVEVLKAYELSPIEVLKDLFTSDIYGKIEGILTLFFDEPCDVDLFISTLIRILDIDLRSFKVANKLKKFTKFAQHRNNWDTTSQWWYLGILEGMLEPARGSDWSTYEGLEPYVKAFWNKVEKVRNKKIKSGNFDGVSFEELLRLKVPQTTEYKADPNVTLQGLLSSVRVW